MRAGCHHGVRPASFFLRHKPHNFEQVAPPAGIHCLQRGLGDTIFPGNMASNDDPRADAPPRAQPAFLLVTGLLAQAPGEGGNFPDDDVDNADQIGVATKTRAKPKKPSQYKVLMLNDDYTPMEFVVLVLKRFFRMDLEQATQVMLHVHQRGVGVCGVFPYEIAETKVTQVMDFARENQHPLQCTLEKA